MEKLDNWIDIDLLSLSSNTGRTVLDVVVTQQCTFAIMLTEEHFVQTLGPTGGPTIGKLTSNNSVSLPLLGPRNHQGQLA